MFRLLRHSFFLVLVLALALPAAAQTLIDKVPADAAFYFGWRGSADMGPTYEGSNLQGMLEEIGLLEAVPEAMDLIKHLEEEGEIGPDEAQILDMVSGLLVSAWTDGVVVYMLPPEPQGPPIPRLCVMWKNGENPEQLGEALNTIAQLLGEQLPTAAGEMPGVQYLAIGFDPAQLDFASLSQADHFKAAAKQVQDDAAMLLYLNAGQWVQQVDQFAELLRAQAEQQDLPPDPFAVMWPTISEAIGIKSLESFAMSAGIDGKNWHTRLFVGAPAPRRGLLSLLDNPPLKPASLLHIPKTATYVQVFSMEPGRILNAVTDTARTIDPNILESINEGLEEINKEIGFDLEDELLRGLGPAWTVYIDPMIAGNGIASVVLVNDLHNADAVAQSMGKLSAKANQFFAEEDDDVKIRFLSRKIGRATVTHLGIPFVSPSWTVHKGKLYVALYPQALEMAVAQSGKREDSILANEQFQSAMARFADKRGAKSGAFEGLKPVTGVSFADLPETAGEGYGTNLMIMQLATGMSEMLTGEPSNVRMPPFGKLLPFIESAGGITRVDQDGLHIHLIEPFPGAALLSASKGITTGAGLTAPMSIAILLPALGEAREEARAVQSLSQSRMIGVANHAYAMDHDGQFADDLAKLVPYLAGDPETLITSRSIRERDWPANFATLPEDQQAKLIRESSSFVLVPLGEIDNLENMSQAVLAFERPDDTDASTLAVTMADGSSRMTSETELAALLKTQTEKTIEQLIERQGNFEE